MTAAEFRVRESMAAKFYRMKGTDKEKGSALQLKSYTCSCCLINRMPLTAHSFSVLKVKLPIPVPNSHDTKLRKLA